MKIAQNVKWGTKGEFLERGKIGYPISTLYKGEIYITNKRVIFRRGGGFLEDKQIMEASYRHISSIEFSRYSRSGYILLGIIVLGTALFFWWLRNVLRMPPIVDIVWLLLGGLSILLFFVTPSNFFKIHIVGREPLVISGELE